MSVIAKLNFFRGMFKSVVAALNESLDITLHLQPLISHFKVSHIMILPFQFGLPFKYQTLEATEFTDIRVLFPPLLHTICLVYSTSKYYNSSARIIVLLTVTTHTDTKFLSNISATRKHVTFSLTWLEFI